MSYETCSNTEILCFLQIAPMKIVEKEVASSSGVSDGDEEEDEDDEFVSSGFNSKRENLWKNSPRKSKCEDSTTRCHLVCSSTGLKSCLPNVVVSDDSSLQDFCSHCVNSKHCNKEVVVSTAQLNENSHGFVIPDKVQNTNSIEEEGSSLESKTKKHYDTQYTNFRLLFESSDESDEGRDHPSDENYEGSEENDEDEFQRDQMYQKSRFNHYQKLLKEHEFQEGGDEEEYLRFLYHRHLYYNQLQKISPKNIKLFRRLEEMQNARFKHSGKSNSSSSSPNNSNTNLEGNSGVDFDFRNRKFYRRSKTADSPALGRFSNYRAKTFSKTSLHQPPRFSRNSGVSSHTTSSTRGHSTCSTSTLAHLDNFLTIPFLLLAFLSFLLVVESVNGCRLSEFTCGTYDCIKADAYCDGEADCPDRTDEPRDCSRKYHAIIIIEIITVRCRINFSVPLNMFKCQ